MGQENGREPKRIERHEKQSQEDNVRRDESADQPGAAFAHSEVRVPINKRRPYELNDPRQTDNEDESANDADFGAARGEFIDDCRTGEPGDPSLKKVKQDEIGKFQAPVFGKDE